MTAQSPRRTTTSGPRTRPARRAIAIPSSADRTAETSVTAKPSHVPNSAPLTAARIGPGTSRQPRTALSTAYTGAPQSPSGSIQPSTSSRETTRRTPNTTKHATRAAASSASRTRGFMPAATRDRS